MTKLGGLLGRRPTLVLAQPEGRDRDRYRQSARCGSVVAGADAPMAQADRPPPPPRPRRPPGRSRDPRTRPGAVFPDRQSARRGERGGPQSSDRRRTQDRRTGIHQALDRPAGRSGQQDAAGLRSGQERNAHHAGHAQQHPASPRPSCAKNWRRRKSAPSDRCRMHPPARDADHGATERRRPGNHPQGSGRRTGLAAVADRRPATPASAAGRRTPDHPRGEPARRRQGHGSRTANAGARSRTSAAQQKFLLADKERSAVQAMLDKSLNDIGPALAPRPGIRQGARGRPDPASAISTNR